MSEDQMMDWKKVTVTNPDGRSYSVESEPKGHPNASILMEIAKEAAINPEYWKEFGWIGKASPMLQIFADQNDLYNAISIGSHEIRRKPRTIRIGNYDVPEFIGGGSIECSESCRVFVDFEKTEDAKLMLKALQELLGAKQ